MMSHLSSLFLLVLLSAVHSQTDIQNHCGVKPCIEPVRMSCEEMIDRYQFQGSCCSLEIIPATGGCRLTVSSGNCFYYPWCGDCDPVEEEASRCNNIFETAANQGCPLKDFDPLEIQSSLDYEVPSCSPTQAPTFGPDGSGGSSTHSKNIVMTGVAGILVAAIASAFVVA
uniref:PSI domain-containing protein n=1 Tax=Pseudo-nitzschia delicatissima TaxID=44447 RepID=A0A7S0UKN6_9STRA|mmetsp:Transcript_35/g.79  ORF Transcript_35/g.79 Transcript_35/m.79 type:complete len:170 (+) Transcript_35:186-695(+)